jgi:hypothetical protein
VIFKITARSLQQFETAGTGSTASS